MAEGRESWAHMEFIMHVTLCEDDRIFVPFHLDDDHSRTWMFLVEDGKMRSHSRTEQYRKNRDLLDKIRRKTSGEYCKSWVPGERASGTGDEFSPISAEMLPGTWTCTRYALDIGMDNEMMARMQGDLVFSEHEAEYMGHFSRICKL